MKVQFLILTLFFFSVTIGKTQTYAPAVGFEGSTAIHKDSSIFIDWAKGTEIIRGYNDIMFPENGYVNYGADTSAIGKASGNPNVVSLGDGGIAILKFNSPIVNGNDFDFAIFENGFFKNDTSKLAFLELAFVEVSTDGIEYIRFPAVSELQTEIQIGSFENINTRYIHNFAGKYTMFYGTPFNLDDVEELAVGTSVNCNEINYIKIIDVIGSIDDEFASYDSEGNKINDPYPTTFPSGGFDLDAVGVINNKTNTKIDSEVLIRPNPANKFISVQTILSNIKTVNIYSLEGKLQISTNKNSNINVENLKQGIYIIEVIEDGGKHFQKFVKR